MAATERWERMTADRNCWVKVGPGENWEPRLRQGLGRDAATPASKRVTENAGTASRKRAAAL